jgi:uncharacterized membrane protein YccC
MIKELLNEFDVTVDAEDTNKAIADIRRASRMGAKRTSAVARAKNAEKLRTANKEADPKIKALLKQKIQAQEKLRLITDRLIAARKEKKAKK